MLLNYDKYGPVREQGDRMDLARVKVAIKLKQKKVWWCCVVVLCGGVVWWCFAVVLRGGVVGTVVFVVILLHNLFQPSFYPQALLT